MSNMKGNGEASCTHSAPSRLRRITSLSGWPRQRVPEESEGDSAAARDDGVVSHANGRMISRSRLRRITSTSSWVFRTNIDAGPTQDTETVSEDSTKGMRMMRRPSMLRLRRIASMPGRSLNRIASRSFVTSQDIASSEEKSPSQMKSQSHSTRKGPSSWFRLSVSAPPIPPLSPAASHYTHSSI